MQSLTFTVAVVFSLLVVTLRPSRAFVAYIASLLFYPSYLVVQLGTLDISVGRIVVAILLLRCLMNHQIRETFKWSVLDSWVAVSLGICFGVPFISYSMPIMQLMETQSGALMDTLCAYIVARLCIKGRAEVISVAKGVAVLLFPLAILGLIETSTSWQPYVLLKQYCPWEAGRGLGDPRFGFARAVGPSGHPILFGCSFALFLPVIYALRYESGWSRLAWVLLIAATFGAMSSMSSGPCMMVIITAGCMVMERFKDYVKPLIIAAVIFCVVVAIISNRTIYHVLLYYINPLGGSGWYRAKLIDLAIEHFDEWWLVGYGNRPLTEWAKALGQRKVDITNEYIMIGIKSGILGIITFVGVLVTAIIRLVRLHNATGDYVLKSWAWALGSGIVALAATFASCSFFAQMQPLYYCFIGVASSLCGLKLRYRIS
jgi:hypothetical protein